MDKNFEFPQFWGFSENVNILGYGHFFRYFLGIPSKFDYFMGLCFTNVWFYSQFTYFGVSFKYLIFWGSPSD